MLGLGLAAGVGETRVGQPEPLRLRVHALDKARFAASHGLGQRHRGVVARLHDQPAQQLVDGRRMPFVEIHARAWRQQSGFGRRHHPAALDIASLQCLKHQVSRHQLGQRCRFKAALALLAGQHLAGVEIVEDPRLRRDFDAPAGT
ncbi:MAG: hypothetical protein EB131_01790 [Betaproteobacteria bacterium]|nr:hypothetical protein [Betaproteobacteria bacterium]